MGTEVCGLNILLLPVCAIPPVVVAFCVKMLPVAGFAANILFDVVDDVPGALNGVIDYCYDGFLLLVPRANPILRDFCCELFVLKANCLLLETDDWLAA